MSAAVSLPPAAAFELRDFREDDRRYVLSTWKRSEGEASGHIEGSRFGPWQDRMMAGILARASVVIASPCGDDAIAGWAAYQLPVLFYVFVRPDARKFGVARMLLAPLLARTDVIYTTRPARERDANGNWQNHKLPIPRSWKCMPRAAFYEVT